MTANHATEASRPAWSPVWRTPRFASTWEVAWKADQDSVMVTMPTSIRRAGVSPGTRNTTARRARATPLARSW